MPTPSTSLLPSGCVSATHRSLSPTHGHGRMSRNQHGEETRSSPGTGYNSAAPGAAAASGGRGGALAELGPPWAARRAPGGAFAPMRDGGRKARLDLDLRPARTGPTKRSRDAGSRGPTERRCHRVSRDNAPHAATSLESFVKLACFQRIPKKPTPGLEPGTPSLRVMCSTS